MEGLDLEEEPGEEGDEKDVDEEEEEVGVGLVLEETEFGFVT